MAKKRFTLNQYINNKFEYINFLLMKNKFIIVPALFVLLCTSSKVISQDELFYGESKFLSCRINIPLFHTKKSDKEVAEKAKELKNKEIVYLRFNSNTGDITYGKYFLVSKTDSRTKTMSNYLVRAEDYKNGRPIAVYPNYSEKTDRFYEAACFDEVLKNNPAIQQKIIEEGKLP